MTDVLQTNIFFVITSLAVIVVTVLMVIALYHTIRILRAVRDIAERLREGSAAIAEDVAQVRQELFSGNVFANILSRFTTLTGMGRRAPRKRRAEKADSVSEDAEDSGDILKS